ncbi:GH92 family glycosyl hydrolase [Flavobacterium sp. MXW15]|uniref:GH92 family glycosyl hydrolase n=1 Tax=Xanthomonas chitinilytica TaxID=2989819 RepID=A0ABT3JZP5_9XANT|nr:GH92 family glycosyl hydrolase [Xanthomonas sp. H13-6]MCW4456252.1 GH92 family glycosyl hydrolase [Flavobacterium sp. MXW15]MCW4473957.1 GH92 family glycosyl hydrolase [Xanthomonas sp. H13-6]
MSRMPSANALDSVRRPLAGLACLLALSFAPLAQAAAPALAAEVNTFIGSKDDGNTFPGASAPFGLIQVSPIGSHYSGWRYDDPQIRGFGHSFVSGAGCWEQGGQVSVLPVTGRIGPGGDFDTADAKAFDHKRYGSRYRHEGEVGQAGYYRVRLTDYGGIDAEATALTRAAAERYTFSAASEGHVLVNVGQANERHSVTGSVVDVVGDRAVEGKLVTKSFCGGHQYTTWFRIEFDRPFKAFGTWGEGGGIAGARHSMEGEAKPNGAWLSFDLGKDRSVTAISAISHVDAEGARNNLRSEGMQGGRLLGFDAMRKRAQAAWDGELASVRVQGGSADDRTVFYTALYHALLQPLTGSDADGRYRGYDDRIHRAEDWTYYEYFSLWDTYRSQNQLLALLRPQRAADIARSLLAIREQGGWLPRWGYASFETNIMTGDPVTPFLVDLWRFGALAGREAEAYAALRENAFDVPPLNSRHAGRSGNPNYLQHGFVQYDRAFPSKGMDVDPHHGGSATLEYALADCSLSLMAGALGHGDDAAVLNRRGRNWRTLWDADVRDEEAGFSGFPRPRTGDGQWYAPADGRYSPRSHHGFHEGTAWQYQWLAQQDVPGLVEAMHGRDEAARRLDAFFAYDALVADPANAARKEWVVGPYSYYNQFRYNPNNEPDLHAPWMYTLIGQPWKTATVLRAAQHLFTNAPNGVTGNDDLGTMSAWYLFSAMGLYPAVPGTGQFLLHAPRFARVDVDLGNGRSLRIEAPQASGDRVQYVRGVSLQGQPHAAVWLDWERLRQGGTLRFDLTDTPPQQGWGTLPRDLPAAPCAAGAAQLSWGGQ